MLISSVIGALLGSRENRQVSVINSFELVLFTEPDITGDQASWPVDGEFFEIRKAQCKIGVTYERCPGTDHVVEEVFPSLTVVGWYTVGTEPTAEDMRLQKKVR